MSARGFGSVLMVASCAGAALGCYLISLRVASERAELLRTENRIAMIHRDIRLVQTEIGTRARLSQLERWNVRVLALSAPSADQFVDGGFALARLIRPEPKPAIEAPVVLASASADAARPQVATSQVASNPDADRSASAQELMHSASLRKPEPARPDSGAPAATKKSGDTQGAASRKTEKTAATAARTDPLAPLPAAAKDRNRKDSGATR